MPIIVFESGAQAGQTVKISPGQSLLFGRDPDAPVPLSEPNASRAHFRVKEHKGQYFLKDLNSTNGTKVNNKDVEDFVCLNFEDRIQVGETIAAFLPDPTEEPRKSAAPVASLRKPPLESKNDPLVGQTIGGYELLSVVGRGGMGTVYLANQLSLHREVALKVLSQEMTADETFVNLFFQEARAAGQLNHPNIVQVYDVGQENNLYFYSMEYLPHGSVEDLLAETEQISVERATAIVLDSARGLVFAERKKLVHRDIKPENLMINEDGIIKIADLGLAKSLAEGSGRAGKEGILGTPHFISPEQARGNEVDTRSDLYSLGASFYRIVSGRTPFVGKRVKDIVRAQLHKTPTPIQEIQSDIPDDVANVIEQLMEKDPADRFQTAEELVEALEAIQRVHHYGHAGRRSRSIVIAGVLIAAAIIVTAFILNNRDVEPIQSTPTTDARRDDTGSQDSEFRKRDKELREARATVALQAATMNEETYGQTADVLAAYRDVARNFEKTDSGKAAWKKVGEVDAYLKALDLKSKQRRARLDSEIARVTQGVEEALKKQEFSRAHAYWATFDSGSLKSDPDYEKLYQALETRILADTETWFDTEASRIESALEASHIEEAVNGAITLRDHPNLDADPSSPFSDLSSRANALAGSALERRNEWERQRYDLDRSRFLTAYQQAREFALTLDFRSASSVWKGLAGQAETDAYRAVFEGWENAYRVAAATVDSCIQFLGEAARQGGANLKFGLPGEAHRGRDGQLTEVTAERVVYTRVVSRQRVHQEFRWADFAEGFIPLYLRILNEASNRGAATADHIALIAILVSEHRAAERLLSPPLASENDTSSSTTGIPNEDVEKDSIRRFVRHELVAEWAYRRAMKQAESGSFESALDDLDLIARQYATSSAYLSRTDGTSALVSRVHFIGPKSDIGSSDETGARPESPPTRSATSPSSTSTPDDDESTRPGGSRASDRPSYTLPPDQRDPSSAGKKPRNRRSNRR